MKPSEQEQLAEPEERDSLKAKLADKAGTVDKLAEMLREREGNMDGLVQKLRKQLHATKVELEASEKRCEELEIPHIKVIINPNPVLNEIWINGVKQ